MSGPRTGRLLRAIFVFVLLGLAGCAAYPAGYAAYNPGYGYYYPGPVYPAYAAPYPYGAFGFGFFGSRRRFHHHFHHYSHHDFPHHFQRGLHTFTFHHPIPHGRYQAFSPNARRFSTPRSFQGRFYPPSHAWQYGRSDRRFSK